MSPVGMKRCKKRWKSSLTNAKAEPYDSDCLPTITSWREAATSVQGLSRRLSFTTVSSTAGTNTGIH